ncbi:MAG: transposase [Nitrososphaerota archaeon]|nr:transposase [Nitrososphaerota archaeon]
MADPQQPKRSLQTLPLRGLNHIRSSRRLEHKCKTNIEAMWLPSGLAPDFKTIADFRKDNPPCYRHRIQRIRYFPKRLNVYDAQRIFIDGSKLKAVNSIDKDFNQKTLAKRVNSWRCRYSLYRRTNVALWYNRETDCAGFGGCEGINYSKVS